MYPDAEFEINAELVRRLLKEQAGHLAQSELRFIDKGWDNESYQLGNDLIIRIPRRKIGEDLLKKEIEFLPLLRKKFSIPVPYPILTGKPSNTYPWVWAIYPWLEGQSANQNQPDSEEAQRLIEFLISLHALNPGNLPFNTSRSVPLEEKAKDTNQRLALIDKNTDFITPKIHQRWTDAISEPTPNLKMWIHGDLHPKNILVKNKKISAIIDWGDMAPGDPATDLCCLFLLFEDHRVIKDAFAQYGASESMIRRSIGWAIYYGAIFMNTSQEKNTDYDLMGRKIFDLINKF